MAWARVDDGWWAHPKVIGLSLAASGLWVRALSWSCHQRKDVVPTRFLAIVGATEEEADELCAAGLWDLVTGGWRIHDWAEYQDQSLTEKRAESGRKGGQASGRVRRAAKQTGEANGKQKKQPNEANGEAGPTRPDPTHPDPSLPPVVTGSTEDDDDLQSAAQSSGVVDGEYDEVADTAWHLATLLWHDEDAAGKVNRSKRTGWVRSTARNIAVERREEITVLLTEGLLPVDAAKHMHDPPRRLRAVPEPCSNPDCVGGVVPRGDDPDFPDYYEQCGACTPPRRAEVAW